MQRYMIGRQFYRLVSFCSKGKFSCRTPRRKYYSLCVHLPGKNTKSNDVAFEQPMLLEEGVQNAGGERTENRRVRL